MSTLSSLLQTAQHWPLHPLFEVLAYFCGYRYFLYLRNQRPDPISSENRVWILVGAAAGGMLVSRLLAMLENPELLSGADWKSLALLSNKTIVGGLLGGLLGVEITKKILRVKTSSGDLMTYPIILGMMIGRVGCFFAGLRDATYGDPTALPWGLDYGDGVRRHPTNLYEILFLGLLWLGLRRLERHKKLANGARFKIFMVAYLSFRLWIEFFKPVYPALFGLSAIQLACLAGLLYYALDFFRPARWFLPVPKDA